MQRWRLVRLSPLVLLAVTLGACGDDGAPTIGRQPVGTPLRATDPVPKDGAAPAARQPAAPEPAAGEPVAPEPAAREPVAPEPAVAGPSADDRLRADRLHATGAAAMLRTLSDPAGLDAAIVALEEAVRLDPTVDAYALDLADAYVRVDTEMSLAFATDLYEDVLSRSPDADAVRGRLVVAYEALGNLESAFREAERRIDAKAPFWWGVALQIASVAFEMDDKPRGVAALRRLVAKAPEERAARILLADLEAQTGDVSAARATLAAATRGLAQDHPIALEAERLAAGFSR